MLKAPIARGLGSCSLRQLGCSAPPHPRARPRPHHGPATAWPTPLPQYPPPPPSILPAGRACSTLYVTPPAGDCGNRRSRPAQAARAGISETAASDPNAFDSNASAVAAAQLLHEALESMEGRIVERLDEQGQQTKDEVKKMVKVRRAADGGARGCAWCCLVLPDAAWYCLVLPGAAWCCLVLRRFIHVRK